jgi:tricorn protease-like protein
MSCRVAFRSTNFLKVSMVTTAAILAACLLALVGTTKPAGATFPGVNGKIAFSRDRGGDSDGDAEIYRMNADGSHLTRLTNNSVDDTQPDWSPDGTKIAFMSGVHKGSNLEIYTMNADGSEQTRLTNDPHGDTALADRLWLAVLLQPYVVTAAIMLYRLYRVETRKDEQLAIGVGAKMGNGLLATLLGAVVLVGYGADQITQMTFVLALLAIYMINFVRFLRHPDQAVIGYKG